MSGFSFTLRRYNPADEDAAIELWRRTWELAYPQLDFTARLPWWRQRWRDELVPVATITVAEAAGTLIGFVTVDPKSFDLDQIVVAPEAWGTPVAAALIVSAKQISPQGLDLHVNTDKRARSAFTRSRASSSRARRSTGAPARRCTR